MIRKNPEFDIKVLSKKKKKTKTINLLSFLPGDLKEFIKNLDTTEFKKNNKKFIEKNPNIKMLAEKALKIVEEDSQQAHANCAPRTGGETGGYNPAYE